MRLITTRDRILSVAKRWQEQYPKDRHGVQTKLDRLDLTIATASHINSVVGNDSWTALACDECGERVDAVVEVGTGSDWDNSTAKICKTCATMALSLFNKEKS